MENRATAEGMTVINRARITFRAHISAQVLRVRVSIRGFCVSVAAFLDIKKSSLKIMEEVKGNMQLRIRRHVFRANTHEYKTSGSGGCGCRIAGSPFARRQPPIQPVLNARHPTPCGAESSVIISGISRNCNFFLQAKIALTVRAARADPIICKDFPIPRSRMPHSCAWREWSSP